MSIILRPKLKVMDCQLISVLASVAVYEAIYDVTGIKAQIKWVNDIYIKDKKVCGILNEGTFDNTNERYKYVVCGIGVNIEPPKNGFADEISNIATSLYERGKAPDGVKDILAREIVKGFFKHYDKIEEREFLKTYESASYLIGKEVDVYTEKEVISGVARGFDENGNLIIEDENGVYHGFYSGEARVRKKGTDL
jgi:BirA family biotin operon repressor/biotin-[acetyl-CoA-carboxylase] ligase